MNIREYDEDWYEVICLEGGREDHETFVEAWNKRYPNYPARVCTNPHDFGDYYGIQVSHFGDALCDLETFPKGPEVAANQLVEELRLYYCEEEESMTFQWERLVEVDGKELWFHIKENVGILEYAITDGNEPPTQSTHRSIIAALADLGFGDKVVWAYSYWEEYWGLKYERTDDPDCLHEWVDAYRRGWFHAFEILNEAGIKPPNVSAPTAEDVV